MPMTQPQRVSLGRLLSLLRADWDDAGTHDAVAELARLDGSPFQLAVQAISQAGNAKNLTPRSVLWPVKAEAQVRALPAAESFGPCPVHFGRSRLPTGEYACCVSESDPDPTPFRRTGTHGPPPEVQKQVEEMQRKATR